MKLNKYIDHTLLKPEATATQIDRVIREAKENHFASVMVNPYWVSRVHKALIGTNVHTATVIGFPLGANATNIKFQETKQAINDGADELDVVMNIGEFKSGNYYMVKNEIIKLVVFAHERNRILKVIVETSLLNDDEKVKVSKLVVSTGADFIKTSTGFSDSGASIYDVKLIVKTVGNQLAVKASGGIHTISDATAMINAGASRLGVSNSMQIIGRN
ncbi:deoxyribose-phosphate aldolase [Ligilactobacillus sp. WILCCON 0076]|uniref:Deoxyribose-phosphate aldolase n=1 Tax=Ligilactobacillus ubinensis TaxID=2876789 RepID=A0A9X2FK06_9LACO|nr:deoxyribose-phosphate aldolase [Ligilactobacillus ubinensis]MCP0887036.1 deoxyribose-phosphate aldolase [Ligilactobacillus ubinensis]